MQLNVCGIDSTLTPAIEQHIKDRVKLAVSHAPGSINDVVVRVRDINGTRGGVDKACSIVAWLRNRAAVVVEAVSSDLYAAVDAAAMKLKQALSRRTRRARTLRREYANRMRNGA